MRWEGICWFPGGKTIHSTGQILLYKLPVHVSSSFHPAQTLSCPCLPATAPISGDHPRSDWELSDIIQESFAKKTLPRRHFARHFACFFKETQYHPLMGFHETSTEVTLEFSLPALSPQVCRLWHFGPARLKKLSVKDMCLIQELF